MAEFQSSTYISGHRTSQLMQSRFKHHGAYKWNDLNTFNSLITYLFFFFFFQVETFWIIILSSGTIPKKTLAIIGCELQFAMVIRLDGVLSSDVSKTCAEYTWEQKWALWNTSRSCIFFLFFFLNPGKYSQKHPKKIIMLICVCKRSVRHRVVFYI